MSQSEGMRIESLFGQSSNRQVFPKYLLLCGARRSEAQLVSQLRPQAGKQFQDELQFPAYQMFSTLYITLIDVCKSEN